MRRLPAVASCIGLLWVIVTRVSGPSDLWHQTQPRTVSYTTAMLVHGGTNWILPVERAQAPATKPPLYNWLAAPVVRVAGFGSELAHKSPSVAALIACWALLVIVGRRLPPHDGTVGWLAALMFVASYSVFKLGYLARPDMLLTLWLLLAWIMATRLLVEPPASAGSRRGLAAGFWLAVALAGLTKGPVALLPIAFVVVAAIPLGGSLKTAHRFRWWWGLPLVVAIVGGWLALALRVDAEHVRDVLWGDEIYGRVTGTGREGSGAGFLGWIQGLYETPAYFLVRFAPWSVLAVAGCVGPWWRDPCSGQRVWRALDCPWLPSAAIMTVTVVVFFAIGASRRADYVVSAFGTGALVGTWWLLSHRSIRATARWAVPAGAAVMLVVLTVHNEMDRQAPSPDFSDGIRSFIRDANVAMGERPADLVCCWTGEGQLQAMLGASQRSGMDAVLDRLERPGPFWLVCGRADSPPHEFSERFARIRPEVVLRPVVESLPLPRAEAWPSRVTLYWVGHRSP